MKSKYEAKKEANSKRKLSSIAL